MEAVINETETTQFTISLIGGDDIDNEDLDGLTRSLQSSLNDVTGVVDATPVTSELQAGAKGVSDVLGKLLVNVAEKAIPAVVDFIKDWITRPGARAVEIEVQGKSGSAKVVFDPKTISVNEVENLVAQLQSHVKE